VDLGNRLGFMQGRLSPLIDGKIQSFPRHTWRTEFSLARTLGLSLMEWTLDQDDLYRNPLLTIEGQREIRSLCKLHSLAIPSLTGDCFMQAPFWKATGQSISTLKADFISVAQACSRLRISLIVVPLVDNGSFDTSQQENKLVQFFLEQSDFIQHLRLRIAFESDYPPQELARFISRLPKSTYGINYDIGNSAALGYLPDDEFSAYGSRIMNVHIKDRLYAGSTVALGLGNADFLSVFRLLNNHKYLGYFILQAARATDDDHVGILRQYLSQIHDWSKSI